MKLKQILPIIGIILLCYILLTLDGIKIVAVFASIPIQYLLLSFLSFVPIVLFFNFEWQLILKRHHIHVSYLTSLKNIFIGYFYGFITPGGFGAYTRVLYLSEDSGETLHKCFANILIFNTVDYLSLLSIGLVGGLYLSSFIPTVFPIFFIVFLGIIGVIAILIRKETGQALLTRLIKSEMLSSKWKDKLALHIDSLYKDIPKITDLLPPYTAALLGWILWFIELFFIAQLFDIHIPFVSFLFIVAVTNVLASIPISIYGLGTREAALLWLFSLYEIPAENVISLSLFWFVLLWLMPSIIGAFVTLNETRKQKGMKTILEKRG